MTWNHLRRGAWGIRAGLFVGLSAAVALPAGGAAVSWDDAGGSASKLWSDFGNWSPNGSPSGDDLFIGNLAAAANDTTLVDAFFSIDSLTISNGADVVNSTNGGATNDFELLVNGPTTVSGAGSSLIIIGADVDGLDTDTLTINSGGQVQLNSQTAQGTAVVEVDNGLLRNNAGGTIFGNGVVEVVQTVASPTSLLINDGTIIAGNIGHLPFSSPPARTLSISAFDPDARFDWDGTLGNGVLQVNGNATLDINVDTSGDAFSGTLNLNTGSTLDIQHAWAMNAGTLNVNTEAFGEIIFGQDPNPGPGAHIRGANWAMSGGTIVVTDAWDTLILDSQLAATDGTINTRGTMVFNGGATIHSGVDFNMIGLDASLTVNSTVTINTPDFNLDGSGQASNVTTINAGGSLNLALGAGADEDFNHTINMNGGGLHVTTADNTWSLTTTGKLNAAGAPSIISGETFNIRGDIDVSGTQLNILAVSSYSSTADVTIGAGSTLKHHGNVTYNGGSYTGAGVFKKGNATIAGNTTWAVDTVDLDDGSTTINSGATLTINADSIETFGSGIDATVTIANAAQLRVNITGGSWQLDDTITYNGGATPPTTAFLAGSRMVINPAATLNVNGEGTTVAPLDIAGTVNINSAGRSLGLFGGTFGSTAIHNMTGGDIGGPGQLEVPSSSRLIGFGRIFADIVTSGSPVLGAGDVLADNGILHVHSILSANLIGTNSSTGGLRLFQPLDTANVTALELNGGAVFGGATINNNGIIRGHGSITAPINNNTEITAQGDILDLNNANHNLDGTGNGVLRVSSGGNMRLINYDTTDPFDGDLIIENNGTFTAGVIELIFGTGGDLIFDGGTYVTNTNHSFNGRITVNDDSTLITILGAVFTLNSGTTHTFNDTLSVEGTLRVLNGTDVLDGGNGTLRINSQGLLRADANASIDPLLLNAGEVRIADNAAGTLNLNNYQQTASGALGIDLAEAIPGSFDRLTVQGNTILDGTLDVSLVGGFTPDIGDAFSLITAAGGVTGQFGGALLPGLPTNHVWSIAYNTNSVVLEVVAGLRGDYNDSGLVEQGDLDLVLQNWGDDIRITGIPTGWVNDLPIGLIEQTELDGVLQNWGSTAAPDFRGSTVPEPAGLVVMASLMATLRGRRAA